MVTALAVLVTGSLLFMVVVNYHNFRYFPRLRCQAPSQPARAVPVSVLIPARNEGCRIANTVTALLNSDHANFEVIVLDDQSEDDTLDRVRGIANGDARVRIVPGAPLPTGWTGKNWACHQLAEHARHDLLLFTDADVTWSPHALSNLVAHARAASADLLTCWPTQQCETPSERLIVPMMGFVLLSYLPTAWVEDPRMIQAAAANGQCLLFSRAAYCRAGGHAATRDTVIEDIRLAQRIKRAGLRLRMVDGGACISCRMYTGLSEVVNGYAKNILAGHANSPTLLLLSVAVHLALFVWPWIWLVLGTPQTGWPTWPILLVALGYAARILAALTSRTRLGDALFLPLSVLAMAAIALYALWLHFAGGGPKWKGRSILASRQTRTDV